MSLHNKIKINTIYTRSVNIKRDSNSDSVLNSYILTTRATVTLKRLLSTLHSTPAPRAWSLVGPYGSGKSSFALFLSHLLGNPEQNNQQSSHKILRKTNKTLAAKLTKEISETKGYLKVLISGSPESLSKQFVHNLYLGTQQFWKEIGKKPPSAVLTVLREITQEARPAISRIIEVVQQLQKAVLKAKGKGILIIIDELGKFLEYEARHRENNDIFLLQSLAEHAYTGGESNVFIFTLLHQTFEQYAKGLGKASKDEWSKIQGRFETIPFLESPEQILRILAEAIKQNFSADEEEYLRTQVEKVVKIVVKNKALSSSFDHETAVRLFTKCYPLHPVTLLLLPLLCQKAAQNERTLFSYLGSHEVHAFLHSLERLKKIGSWIYPWEIYDYFILNQSSVIFDHFTHQRWTEVMTALDRLGDAPKEEVNLLKSIGLLNIVGSQGGFKASKEIVGLCLPKKGAVKKALVSLQEKSIIQYRKYNKEYRVWQGSDFDLERAVQEEINQIGRLELASLLNTHDPLLPLVGRKHSIKTGALRYFLLLFIDSFSYKTVPQQSKKPRIIFFLSETTDDKDIFTGLRSTHFSENDILVLCENGTQIREAVAEVIAIKRIQTTKKELHSDPVAQFDLKVRLNAALAVERSVLNSLVDSPESNRWYWRQNSLVIKSKRALQSEVSNILDTIYRKTPILKNELINRDKPSNQAVAARNKLLLLLHQHADKEDLGMEKYPPQKTIYKALIKATGLHKEIDQTWQLTPPTQDNDPYNIMPIWECIEKFLEKSEKEPLPFKILAETITAPPYGVKEGVLPILYCTALLIYQYELAIYENNIYLPYLTDEHIELLARRPETFKVQRFRIEGVRASLFKEYSKALKGTAEKRQNVLSIVRPLAKFMASIPEYTKNTRRLSQRAQQVKNAFELSKSPQKLLFSALPTSCGFDEINPDDEISDLYNGFAETLIEIFRELNNFYQNQLKNLQGLFCEAFFSKIISLSELRASLRVRLDGLLKYSIDRHSDGLRAFIFRIMDKKGDDETWFLDLLSFLGRKPFNKWSDVERDTAEYRLSEYVYRISDLERLHRFYLKTQQTADSNFDVILLKAIRHGKTENNELVYIDKKCEESIHSVKQEIKEKITRLKDNKLKLALLAGLVDELLEEQNKSATQEEKSKEPVRIQKKA